MSIAKPRLSQVVPKVKLVMIMMMQTLVAIHRLHGYLSIFWWKGLRWLPVLWLVLVYQWALDPWYTLGMKESELGLVQVCRKRVGERGYGSKNRATAGSDHVCTM